MRPTVLSVIASQSGVKCNSHDITEVVFFFFQNKNINEVEKGRNSCLDIDSLVQKKPITPAEVSTGRFKLRSRKCVRKK